MEVRYMRDHVRNAYSGKSWIDKVNAMDDRQILAVYKRLILCGKIKRTR